MKNIIYLLIVLLAGLGITSCSDSFLDVAPTGQLSDATFWETEEDVELALTGAYNNWEGAENIMLGDAQSDNGYEQISYGPFRARANGEMSPDNFWEGGWATPNEHTWFHYQRIRKYNNFLTKIENVPMDDQKKERYKAEVRFLRTYDYFNKVMFFGDVPLVTELIGSDEKPPRTPAEEVKQFILEELDEIKNILPVQNILESEGHVTSGAALALKARLELFMENYADAMASSKAVIDMGVYELYPDYRELFLEAADANNRESILEIQHVADDYNMSVGGWGMTRMNLPGGDGGFSMSSASWDMIAAYETSSGLTIEEDPTYDPDNPFDNRDPRLEMTIVYPGQQWNDRFYNSLDPIIDGNSNPDYHQGGVGPRGGNNVKKWVELLPSSQLDNHGNNIMVIRLAEMYLTYAEAAVETGQNTELALDYINEIRERAGHVEATELTRELVRRERRVELAFEALRLFDIKRWGIAMDVMPGPLYGVRTGTVDTQTGEVTWDGTGDGIADMDGHILIENRNFTERNLLFPIPQHEMDANPNMTQNPGY